MLAKRKPLLIAIDEAHCISNGVTIFALTIDAWPVSAEPSPCAGMALTATATPLVQNDIAIQLGLTEPTHLSMDSVAKHRIEL